MTAALEIPPLSYSSMKYLIQSPRHFRAMRDNPPEPSEAMLFGQALHMAVLEPERFREAYTYLNDAAICKEIGGAKPRATKAYKEWLSERDRDAAKRGATTISRSDYLKCKDMSEAALSHSVAGDILRAAGECEKTIEWVDEVTGVPMVARLDKLMADGRIVDIKTCRDASSYGFYYDVWNFVYYLQGVTYLEATYSLGLVPQDFTFIAIENTFPYAVAVYDLDSTAIEAGIKDYAKYTALYAECAAADRWPLEGDSYSEAVQLIGAPVPYKVQRRQGGGNG